VKPQSKESGIAILATQYIGDVVFLLSEKHVVFESTHTGGPRPA